MRRKLTKILAGFAALAALSRRGDPRLGRPGRGDADEAAGCRLGCPVELGQGRRGNERHSGEVRC